MTATHHTPGPWKAQRDIRHQLNTGTLTDDSPKAWAVYGQSKRVACVSETLGVDWDKDARAEADAHLIAAAPELLAAAEAMLASFGWQSPNANPESEAALADARAAIAKAKGGAA